MMVKISIKHTVGHDVIGHPEVETDNSGLGLCGIENRLAIGGLQ